MDQVLRHWACGGCCHNHLLICSLLILRNSLAIEVTHYGKPLFQNYVDRLGWKFEDYEELLEEIWLECDDVNVYCYLDLSATKQKEINLSNEEHKNN